MPRWVHLAALTMWIGMGCAGGEPTQPPSEDDRNTEDRDTEDRDTEDSAAPADPWAALRVAIDGSDVTDLVVLIGTAEGVQFAHTRGSVSAEDTLLLASASKWLAAMTVLAAVDDGLMSLDDHPQDYLSWWTDDPSDPRSAVTLEQLLSFTSGLRGGIDDVPCVEDADTTLDACAQEIYANFFETEPGTTFVYGPAHLQVAGAMLSAATGDTFHRVFRDQIGTPLGLGTRTGFGLPSLANPRVAGGGTSSAEDYAAVLTALTAGDLLSPDMVARLVRDHTGGGVVMEDVPDAVRALDQDWHYALGCWRECDQSAYSSACDAPGVVSSPGAFGFYPWWDRQSGLWGLIAVQLIVEDGGAVITIPLGQEWSRMAKQALGLD